MNYVEFVYVFSKSGVRFFVLFWFVFCFGFFVPLENFSLVWRRQHDRWRAVNFHLCSALMAIEQWGFFFVPHLFWQGTSVSNGHLRGPVTLRPILPSVWQLSCHYLFDLGLSLTGFAHPTFRLRGERSYWMSHRRWIPVFNFFSHRTTI